MWRWVVLGVGLGLMLASATACSTTATHAGIRAQCAKRWECAESAITVTNESPTIVRVSGCGRSAIYVCQPANEPEGSSQMPMEHEYQTNRGGGCGSWSRQSEE